LRIQDQAREKWQTTAKMGHDVTIFKNYYKSGGAAVQCG